jgi:hypothetical protein
MRGLQDAQKGYRTLLIGKFIAKPGQKSAAALRLIETVLIRAAMVEGYEILNIKGVMTPVHTLAMRGNRHARGWLPVSKISVPRGNW